MGYANRPERRRSYRRISQFLRGSSHICIIPRPLLPVKPNLAFPLGEFAFLLTRGYRQGRLGHMPESITANQLVAYNMARIRKTLGLSQEEAAERLEPHLGTRWSKTVYSTIERSYQGKRVRQFTGDDLVAFSRAFGVPVTYFFLPPKPEDRTIGEDTVTGVRGGDKEISWPELFEVMFGGEMRAAFIQRLAELPREERPAADSYLAALLNTTVVPTSMEDYARLKERMEPAFGRAPEEPPR